ncbi:MAG: hypothetical protein ACR2OA_14155 [Rubripirellula sp.]
MKKYALTVFAAALTTICSWNANYASAQNQTAILAETYGQGVHAYNGGRLTDAVEFFSLAIENGSQDPRVYYYRGIVNYVSGRPEEAVKDWQAGAGIEALGGPNPSIGRSLARFQGNGRLKLEQIRQAARIEALAKANARSRQRYGEIRATPENSAAVKPAPRAPSRPITPPPTPPAAANPFASGVAGQAAPTKMTDDALAGAMQEPFDDKPNAAAGGAPAAAGGDPFGGGSAPAAGADPFGGGGAPAAGADPFGGGGAPAAGADPFGGGGAPAAGADPFGGDPFGG